MLSFIYASIYPLLSIKAKNSSYVSPFRYASYKRLETFERDGYRSLKDECNYNSIVRGTKHDPLPSGKNLHVTNVVTMLREPKARMISAFLYGIHNAGKIIMFIVMNIYESIWIYMNLYEYIWIYECWEWMYIVHIRWLFDMYESK